MASELVNKCFGTHNETSCQMPSKLPSNDAIAGPATIYPFIAISSTCVLGTLFAMIRSYYLRQKAISKFIKYGTIWLVISRSLADVQLIASSAYSLAALILNRDNNISTYHYNLVCYLALAATFTSASSMLVHQSISRKLWGVSIRIIFMMMSTILLLILLGPRWSHYQVFPGRAPSLAPNESDNTALVIQASCLLKLDWNSECRFLTDQHPKAVIEDVWAIFPLIVVVASVFGSVGNWVEFEYVYGHWGTDSDNDIEVNSNKKWVGALVGQIFCIAISASWTGNALRQFWLLRKWMNDSGLLLDKKEMSISSFGAFVPFFTMTGTFSFLIATTMDELSIKKDEKSINIENPIELEDLRVQGQVADIQGGE